LFKFIEIFSASSLKYKKFKRNILQVSSNKSCAVFRFKSRNFNTSLFTFFPTNAAQMTWHFRIYFRNFYRFWRFRAGIRTLKFRNSSVNFSGHCYVKPIAFKLVLKLQYDLKNTVFYAWLKIFNSRLTQFRFIDILSSLFCRFCHNAFLSITSIKIFQICWNLQGLFELIYKFQTVLTIFELKIKL